MIGNAIPGKKALFAVVSAVILAAGCSDPIGSADAVIALDSRAPLVVELTLGGGPTVASGAALTLSAEVEGGSPPYTYRWFLNGTAQEALDGPVATFGPGLSPRTYRVGVVISDGATLGSAEAEFEVTP